LIQPLGNTVPEMTPETCNKSNEYAEALEVGTNRIIAQCSCDNSVKRNGVDTAVQSRDDGTRAYLDPYGQSNGKPGKTPTPAGSKPAVPAIGTLSCMVPPYALASSWDLRTNWSKVPGSKGYLVKLLQRDTLAYSTFKYVPSSETSYVFDQRAMGTEFTSKLNPSGGEYDMTLYSWDGTAWNEVDKKKFTCSDPTLGARQGWLDDVPGTYYGHQN